MRPTRLGGVSRAGQFPAAGCLTLPEWQPPCPLFTHMGVHIDHTHTQDPGTWPGLLSAPDVSPMVVEG